MSYRTAICEKCESWENEGTVVMAFPSESDFKKSEFYDGQDNVKDDPHASKAVWVGKNNVGRSYENWWICTPVHPNCVTTETNILTKNGLKSYEEISVGDMVLSLNPKTLEIEETKVKSVIIKNYNGKIYHLKNRGYDLKTTPDHRNFIRIRKRLKGKKQEIIYKFATTKELLTNKEFTIPRTGYWKGIERNEREVLLASLYGWVISEGCLKSSAVYISQLKEKNRELISSLLIKLNISFSTDKFGFYLRKSNLTETLRKDCLNVLQPFRNVPMWIKESDKKTIQSFLDSYLAGDGHYRKLNVFGYESEEKVYCSSSKKLIQDIAELTLKIGNNCNVYLHTEKGKVTQHRNGLYASNYDVWGLRESRSNGCLFNAENKSSITELDYNGIVWCVELEKNHIWVYETNGVYGFTGNCQHSWQSYEPGQESLDDDIKDFGIDLLSEQAEENKKYRQNRDDKRRKSHFYSVGVYSEIDCSCPEPISLDDWTDQYIRRLD